MTRRARTVVVSALTAVLMGLPLLASAAPRRELPRSVLAGNWSHWIDVALGLLKVGPVISPDGVPAKTGPIAIPDGSATPSPPNPDPPDQVGHDLDADGKA